MATLSRMTELESVNAILSMIGEAPLNTLVNVSSLDAIGAHAELRKATREVLQDAWWFNSEKIELTANGLGEFVIPSDYLSVQPAGDDLNAEFVQRGGRLYNLKNNTFTGNAGTITVFAVRSLDWSDLPSQAQYYIYTRAARNFAQKQIGEPGLYRAAALEERAASASLHNENLSQLKMSRMDNSSLAAGFRTWR